MDRNTAVYKTPRGREELRRAGLGRPRAPASRCADGRAPDDDALVRALDALLAGKYLTVPDDHAQAPSTASARHDQARAKRNATRSALAAPLGMRDIG